MPVLVPSKLDTATGLFKEVFSTPTYSFDSAFDSNLILHNGHENHTLTLVLKINLNQILPSVIPNSMRMLFPDANGNFFLIKPWTHPDFVAFSKKFVSEATMWNDNFWLIPPAGFSKLDVKIGNRTVRPNIYCHLYVTVVSSPSGAHRTIDIVNLDTKAIAAQRHVRESDLTSGTFRSNESRYDSLDIKQRTNYMDDQNGLVTALKYFTVPHEIGHALGLPHIGVSHLDPLCNIAMAFETMNPTASSSNSFPALYRNGSNSQACYGHSGPPNRGANIMGAGMSFDETNAQPWIDRIAYHTQTTPASWTVSMTKLPPKIV